MKSWVDQTYHQKYQMNPVNKQVNLILRQGLTYTWNQIPFKCHFCELKLKNTGWNKKQFLKIRMGPLHSNICYILSHAKTHPNS